ncbi:MAG: fimbrillin family protein, partial [Bacteroidales bacterium]
MFKQSFFISNQIFSLFLACGLFCSCVDDGSEPSLQKEETSLRFTTSILGVATDNGSTRGAFMGNAFPEGESNIGMFVSSSGGTLPSTVANMKAVLTKTAGSADSWRFLDGSTVLYPMAQVGGRVEAVAYYPWNSSGTKGSVPFDLSTSASQLSQEDLMFATTTETVSTASPIRLQFQHAYTLIELKLKKHGSGSLTVKEAVLENIGSKRFICNKGTMNPVSGSISPSQYGSVAVKQDVELSEGTAQSFHVMVPPFMSTSYADNDIFLTLKYEKEGSAGSTSFNFRKSYLNQANGGWGFKQGVKNIYNLVLEASAVSSVNVSLESWEEISATDNNIGGDKYIGQDGQAAPRIYVEGSGPSGKLMLTKSPTNPGSFFQFGSILAWSGVDPLALLWNPSTITSSSWNSSWGGFTSFPAHSIENLRNGQGDPCRLVGFTQDEIKSMLQSNQLPDNGAW